MTKSRSSKLNKLIIKAPVSIAMKKNIIAKLPYLSEEKIYIITKELQKLTRMTEEYLHKSRLIDMKYQLKVEREIKKAKSKLSESKQSV